MNASSLKDEPVKKLELKDIRQIYAVSRNAFTIIYHPLLTTSKSLFWFLSCTEED